MKIKVSNKDIIWNYIGVIMTLGSNFLLLPFMMVYLDSNQLGLWYVFQSIGNIVVLFDFGFNPTLARNVAYCWSGVSSLKKEGTERAKVGTPNYKLLKQVIETCKKLYLIISLSAFLIMISFGTIYIINISNELIGYNYIIAWIIYSCAVFSNLYFGYYATMLRGVGAISQMNIANVISRVLQIIISIILLYLGLGLVAAALGYFINGFIYRSIAKYYFYNYKNNKENLKNVSSTILKEDIKKTFSIIWHNAWKDGLVSVSNYLTTQASALICSTFLTLTETGIYSITLQIVTAIVTFAGSLYNTYQPSLQSAYVNNDVKKSKELMAEAMIINFLICLFGAIGVIIIGFPILSVFKPETKFSIPLLVIMIIYQYLVKRHSYYASYIANTNKITYMNAFIISSICGVILSTIFMKYTNLGVYGLVLGQMISQMVYNNWKWPRVVFSMLESNNCEFILIGIEEINNKVKSKINKSIIT
ncbi:MAG: O-unit flippase-like protein [Clostridium saudiense]|uniref:O-unit flippase-like protein n=1 Tax=Clostridium saudiense TaxID=1414720 RepID=UPI0039922A46